MIMHHADGLLALAQFYCIYSKNVLFMAVYTTVYCNVATALLLLLRNTTDHLTNNTSK